MESDWTPSYLDCSIPTSLLFLLGSNTMPNYNFKIDFIYVSLVEYHKNNGGNLYGIACVHNFLKETCKLIIYLSTDNRMGPHQTYLKENFPHGLCDSHRQGLGKPQAYVDDCFPRSLIHIQSDILAAQRHCAILSSLHMASLHS